jgi:hypothetical protein
MLIRFGGCAGLAAATLGLGFGFGLSGGGCGPAASGDAAALSSGGG